MTNEHPIENKERESVQAVQMNTCQKNTYREDGSWLNFDDEPRVQKRQQLKDKRSYIPVSVAYILYPSNIRSTSSDMSRVFHAKPYGRFIEIKSNLKRKKLHGMDQGLNFLGGSFSNRINSV